MAETRKPTPEVPVNPAEALQGVKQHRVFESRNIGQFFEAKTDPESVAATQQVDRVKITGNVLNSDLSFRIEDFNGAPGLWIQNLHRHPDPSRSLASVYHGDGILIGRGGLEGGYHGMLSHPDAAETLKLIQELTEVDRKTRNVHSILEGFPYVWRNTITTAYLQTVEKFSDPTQLRLLVGASFVQPPESLTGIIDDPRLHLAGEIHVLFNGRSLWNKDKTPFCWINWHGDNGEEFKYPRQTIFEYVPTSNSFVYGEGTAGLDRRTVRHELSEKMLTSLNEGRKAPEGFGGRARTFLRKAQA